MFNSIITRLRNEPALLGGIVTAALALIAAIGFSLSPNVVAAVSAATALIISLLVRSQVSPVSNTVVPVVVPPVV